MARFRPILHHHGLTDQQWRTLRALDDLGELTAAGLAQECSILAPSMTRILRKLGEQGLITVTRSQADLRELSVEISPTGRQLVATVGPKVEREYARIREQLRPEYFVNLHRDLQQLIDLGSPTTER